MYYKAELFLSTESMYWDAAEKAYIGYNPETRRDHGIVDTITASTLEELASKLHHKYSLKNAEVFEGLIEMQFDGEHDYRTPKEDRIPFCELYTVIISKVVETQIDASEVLKVKGAL